MNKPKKQNKTAVPIANTFTGKKFHVFRSFEEANEATYKAWANTSPEKHIYNTVKLIKKIYGISTNTTSKDKLKITQIKLSNH